MKLLAQLINLVEAKAKKKAITFVVKDWDDITLGKHPDLSVGPIDIEVSFNLGSDGDVEDLEIVSVDKVEVMKDDGYVLDHTLPARTPVEKLPGFTEDMLKDIERKIDKNIEQFIQDLKDDI